VGTRSEALRTERSAGLKNLFKLELPRLDATDSALKFSRFRTPTPCKNGIFPQLSALETIGLSVEYDAGRINFNLSARAGPTLEIHAHELASGWTLFVWSANRIVPGAGFTDFSINRRKPFDSDAEIQFRAQSEPWVCACSGHRRICNFQTTRGGSPLHGSYQQQKENSGQDVIRAARLAPWGIRGNPMSNGIFPQIPVPRANWLAQTSLQKKSVHHHQARYYGIDTEKR